MATVVSIDPSADQWSVPIGKHSRGALMLNLERLLAGRLLIQGSSGAGKSRTLRKIIEEAFDFTTIVLVDPEGEFADYYGKSLSAPEMLERMNTFITGWESQKWWDDLLGRREPPKLKGASAEQLQRKLDKAGDAGAGSKTAAA